MLETKIKAELNQLFKKHRILLNDASYTLSELIDLMSEAKLRDEPVFIKLAQLDAAMCQLDIGLYGLCSDCEAEIEVSRLNANPLEQRCTSCSTRYSHEHRLELRLSC